MKILNSVIEQVTLACIRGKGCVPVVGLTSASVERLDEAFAFRGMRLIADKVKFLEEPHVPKPVAGHV